MVALSSTEAEYMAATEAAKEATWLKGLLEEIDSKSYIPVINIDSQSALYLCKDPMYHERTKHIDVRFHYIRKKVKHKHIIVQKIKGDLNPSDFGTKIVTADKFAYCRNFLHIYDVH